MAQPTASPHFCFECGHSLEYRTLDNRVREVCPACGWVYYAQLKTGAGTIVEKNGRLLMMKRGHNPWKGWWNIPAGYCEADETPAAAAIRETLEETGLQVRTTSLFGMYFYDDDPRGSGVVHIYSCEITGGLLMQNDESPEFKFFLPKEIPAELAGGAHDQAILDWKQRNL